MAQIGSIEMPVSSAMRDITLSVRLTGLRKLAVRLWIGARLLKLAAWVLGCQVDVEIDETPWMVVDGQPPRRIEVGHRLYDHSVGQKLRVYLDGVEQREVIAYDLDAGTLVRFSERAGRELCHGTVTAEWDG